MVAIAAALTVAVPAAWGGGADLIVRHELALIVWAAVLIGLVAGLLPRALPGPTARPLVVGLAAVGGLSALALVWTSSSERTVEEIARVAGYGGFVVLGLLAIERRYWKAAAVGISIAAPAICALALAARLYPVAFTDSGAAISGGRLSYPFGYWNALATWSGMAIVIALAWAVNARRRGVRAAALAAIPIAGACLYLTYSRGGLIVTAFGVVAVIALSRDRAFAAKSGALALGCTGAVVAVIRGEPQVATAAGTDGAALVLAAILAASTAAGLVSRVLRGPTAREPRAGSSRIRNLVLAVLAFVVLAPAAYSVIGKGEPVASSPSDPAKRLFSVSGSRPLYWRAALDDFADAPLEGKGPGTYGFSWTAAGLAHDEVLDAHSLFLEALAELGIFGLIAVVLWAGGGLSHALVPLRTGDRSSAAIAMPVAFAVYVCSASIDWMWESTAVTIFALSCALAAGAAGSRRAPRGSSQSKSSAAGPRRDRQSRRRLWIAATAVFALISIALEVPGLVATQRVRASETALLLGLTDRAEHLASDAVRAAPWAASPREQLAVVELLRGDERAARADALRAVRAEPLNYRRWLVLALIEKRSDDRSAATDAYRTARRLAPAVPSFSRGFSAAIKTGVPGLAP